MTLRNPRNFFQPESVAIFGASGRAGRPGYDIIAGLTLLGSTPRIYPITPRYAEILGYTCLPDASTLPEPVDLAIIASGTTRILTDTEAAINAGARALHIIGDLPLNDCAKLGERIAKVKLDLVGPNSIGYINYQEKTLSSWIAPPKSQRNSGNISLIVQSGALFSYANEIDPRLQFNMSMHPGRELGVTLSDVLNYAVSLPSTKVVGLYLETITDPVGFISALERASIQNIPIVVLSPGQSNAAAHAIATHARRLAGGTAALESIFRRFAVTHVKSLDEFWCTLRAFSANISLAPGGVAVVTDSGAQRAMTLDAAEVAGVRLAKFSDATESKLRTILDSELEPQNPLDIWAGEEDLETHVGQCLEAALQDDDTAIAIILTDFGVPDLDSFPTRLAEGALRAKRGTKSCFAVNFATRHFYPERIYRMEASGIPVLDGLEMSLKAIGHLFKFRDRMRWASSARLEIKVRSEIAEALKNLHPADEHSALNVLRVAGVPIVEHTVVNSRTEALASARTLTKPVVMKTAEGHLHKTEVKGVHLDLRSEVEIAAAYEDLKARIGSRAIVAPMLRGRCELALGAIVDPNFGPLVMIGAGGEFAEIHNDRLFALAPVSQEEALDMLANLRLSPFLDAHRGKPAIDRQRIAQVVVNVSKLIAEFADQIAEIDVNPLIVGTDWSVAVDAVIIAKLSEAV